MARGLFLLFEGCDRSGKSTQCSMLVEALQREGVKAKLLKFPDRTTAIGQMINGLSDEAAMEDIRAELEAGTTLVVDRYAFSGVAFSACKGLSMKWCKAPDVGLIAPGQNQGGTAYGEEVYEKREFQIEVRVKFFALMEANWSIVDANRDKDTIHRQIMNLSKALLKRHEKEPLPLGKLWVD
ncbi:P-loop containing nucleoside triphosphate hydrolase protein [Linderina pennispora]|uniref:dTMP kinase n=1 Tax=Linderina pennispora TaxID=61395 RepID=A0A1Y1VXY6_9FUNG|nr:P-loop containing nucleoside triphosphate hydrolase protein [Linderina pennispora]ORX66131.1 P-loop containing nucleoside triphosphate hydrolase protein [Linderina pennispora]